MKVLALNSFSGLDICMAIGEERDITDDALLEDLLSAGLVEPADKVAVNEDEPVEGKKTGKRSSTKVE